MTRILSLVAAGALLFVVGCKDETPMAPPPAGGDGAAAGGDAIVGPGGKIKLSADNTKITFVGSKPGKEHKGGFKNIDGELTARNMQPGGTIPEGEHMRFTAIDLTIDAESLYSDDEKLTGHLKNQDFFDVGKYKKITFKSTKIERVAGSDDMKVTGDMTLLKETKPKTFILKSTVDDKGRLHATCDFKLSRKEFGMTFDKGGVADEVSVSFAIGKPSAKKG